MGRAADRERPAAFIHPAPLTMTNRLIQEKLMTPITAKLTILRRSLALAGALASMSLTAISFAAASHDVQSVAVRYGDLNLATAAGINTLYRRISNAAYDVCLDAFSRNMTVVAPVARCRAEAIARAVADVNNQQLTLLQASRVSRGSH